MIGTGGGRDLLSALVFGARSVDGVEINPIIVNDVMREKFRDYSGGLYDRPEVHVTVEDGRSFVRRSPKHYDIIQASLVDTWAATAAGAYALSENSLYTVEAFDDYLDHLTDRGVLSVSRWVFDGLRLISLAQEAGARRGWNPADRLAIVQQDKVATFLLKKTPFTRGGNADSWPTRCATISASPIMYLPGRPVPDLRRQPRRLRAPDSRARIARRSTATTRSTSARRPTTGRSSSTRHGCATTGSIAPVLGLFGVHVERAVEPGLVGDRRPDGAPGAAGDLLLSDRALHRRAAGGDLARARWRRDGERWLGTSRAWAAPSC